MQDGAEGRSFTSAGERLGAQQAAGDSLQDSDGLDTLRAHVTKAAVISKIPHKRPAQKTAGSSWGFSWFASLISWLFQQSETPGQTFRAWPAPYNTVYAGRLGWQNYPDPSLALPAGLVSDVSMLLLLVIPEQSAIDNDRCPGNIAASEDAKTLHPAPQPASSVEFSGKTEGECNKHAVVKQCTKGGCDVTPYVCSSIAIVAVFAVNSQPATNPAISSSTALWSAATCAGVSARYLGSRSTADVKLRD